MQKTPSYLKGLAENRARAAAEVTRYARLLNEIQSRLSVAQADLVACDQLIRRFDARLNPNDIAPIHGWKGRYGKRGDLIQAIQRILQEAAPYPVSTPTLALLLRAEFELDFETPAECRRWVRNSVCNRLREMVQDGSVERLHDWGLGISESGSWRWIAPADSLECLKTLASKNGAAVVEGPASEHLADEGCGIEECDDDELPC